MYLPNGTDLVVVLTELELVALFALRSN